MFSLITSDRFHGTAGLEAWQVRPGAAFIVYRVPDFAAGGAFAARIAEIAEEVDHHPDIDLRYGWMRIRTATHRSGGLTSRDIVLAQRITELADSLGFVVEDSGEPPQDV